MPKKAKLAEWTLSEPQFRDIHGSDFVEAICPHGIGHHKGVHGCDGCCSNPPLELWARVSKDTPTNAKKRKAAAGKAGKGKSAPKGRAKKKTSRPRNA